VSPAFAIMRRDLVAARRGGGGVPLAFFLLVSILLPLGIGADPQILPVLSSGAVWVGALLACLLSLDRLFQADWEDGSLTLLRTAPISLEMAILAKCFASWLTTGLPLVLAAPLVGVLHGLDPASWGWLALSLLIGTPSLTLLGTIGAALSVGLRSSSLLIPILIVPLCVPTLIFGSAVAAQDPPSVSALLYLCAIGLFMLWLAPIVSAMAIRQSWG